MKTTHLKWIAIFLSTLMLMQSCNIYSSQTSTIDDAIEYNSKIKAVTFYGDTYKFHDLIREEGQLYGITKEYSSTAKKLETLIVNETLGDRYVKISVLENTIKGYYLKNKPVSTILTGIAFTPVLLILLVVAAVISGDCCY